MGHNHTGVFGAEGAMFETSLELEWVADDPKQNSFWIRKQCWLWPTTLPEGAKAP